MAESKTREANYSQRSDIVHQDDTTFVRDTALNIVVSATAFAQHTTKRDSEEVAEEARAATAFGGNVTSPDLKRGKK